MIVYKYIVLHIQWCHGNHNYRKNDHTTGRIMCCVQTTTLFSSQKDKALSYHGCGLGCHGCLTDMLLTGFDFGLQVCRRVKILALLPGAATLDVVHANSDSVISGVNHWTVTGVSKAAVCLPSCTASPLKLAAHLRAAIINKVRGIHLSA